MVIILGMSGILFLAFVLFASIALFKFGQDRDVETFKKGNSVFGSSDAVGVVELQGVILDSKETLKNLSKFEERSEVKAIVMRLDSPGGAVAPSQEIYQAVKNYKKPVVMSMGSVAASGAFYISAAGKKVFANPGTLTGSIGVIMEFVNLEKLYDWAKVKRYSLTSGRYKAMGSSYKSMTPEERELLQQMIDEVLHQFAQAVATGRHMKLADVMKVADGRIMNGEQAKNYKLVDELGGIDDAIQEAAKLGGIKGKPRVVYPRQEHGLDFLDLVLDKNTTEDMKQSLNTVIEKGLFRPGLYWLWAGAR